MTGYHKVIGFLVVGALVQLFLGVQYQSQDLVRIPKWRESFDKTQVFETNDLSEAHRALLNMEPCIPKDASVLVLGGSLYMPSFEFYLLPREIEVLIKFDPAMIDLAQAVGGPDAVSTLKEWQAFLQKHDLVFEPARFDELAKKAEYLITYRFGEFIPGSTWHLIESYGEFTRLYARVEGG